MVTSQLDIGGIEGSSSLYRKVRSRFSRELEEEEIEEQERGIGASSYQRKLRSRFSRELEEEEPEEQEPPPRAAPKENVEERTRGPTYMMKIWGRPSHLPRMELDYDELGLPIGTNGQKLAEFLGTIARNSKLCPIDVENWHQMPKKNKKEMLDNVKLRFDISITDEDWILQSIDHKWRNWKHELKTKYFLPNRGIEEYIDERDERVNKEQWIKILQHWNKEKIEEQSQKNKIARSKKLMDHSTGKRSFAQVRHNLKKEKGCSPSRADIFEACHNPKNGNSFHISGYLAEMRKRQQLLPQGSKDSISQNDIFAQVVGQDKPGWVRMMGGGVRPSDIWGEGPSRNTYKRVLLEQNKEMREMKDAIYAMQAQLWAQRSSKPNNLSNIPSTAKSLQVGAAVSLKSISDPTKIVAKGYLHSIDPNAEVGGYTVGKNWCQIHVSAVLHAEEQLIRPYGFYKTIGDTIGEMVAWPCSLVN